MNLVRSASALLMVLVLAFAACDTDHRRSVLPAPSPFANSAPFGGRSPFGPSAPFVGTTLLPSTIVLIPVQSFQCPSIGPFTTSFALVIDQSTGSDIFMNEAAFRFVDGSGLPSPLNLTRSDLVGMFGTTLVPSGITRTFNFRPQFGCGFVSQPQIVFIDVSFVDGFGGTHRTTTTATIK